MANFFFLTIGIIFDTSYDFLGIKRAKLMKDWNLCTESYQIKLLSLANKFRVVLFVKIIIFITKAMYKF